MKKVLFSSCILVLVVHGALKPESITNEKPDWIRATATILIKDSKNNERKIQEELLNFKNSDSLTLAQVIDELKQVVALEPPPQTCVITAIQDDAVITDKGKKFIRAGKSPALGLATIKRIDVEVVGSFNNSNQIIKRVETVWQNSGMISYNNHYNRRRPGVS